MSKQGVAGFLFNGYILEILLLLLAMSDLVPHSKYNAPNKRTNFVLTLDNKNTCRQRI
eukprot:m.302484 g.302484  ORF g.302484 m.302484 type:complete len:58 (-) comp16435_c0_seq24:3787-3960(-)